MKSVIKLLIPPFVLIIYRKVVLRFFGRYGWFGDYKSFEDAKRDSTGYQIKEVSTKSAENYVNIAREYNKEGVDIGWREKAILPSLAVIQRESETGKDEPFKVLDFGGGGGEYFFRLRRFIRNVHWDILDTPEMVRECKSRLNFDGLHFYADKRELLRNYDVVIMNCVLPFLENPIDTFSEISRFSSYTIVNRLPLTKNNVDRLTIQKVDPKRFAASYPFWFFSENKFLKYISNTHSVLMTWENEEQFLLDGKMIVGRGFLLKAKSAQV